MNSSCVHDYHLRATIKIPFSQVSQQRVGPHKFYDVKFYPYSNSSQVFAIVGVRLILICRPPQNEEESLVILKSLYDRENIPETGPDTLNSCEWNYIDPSEPLLSVAGVSGLVKVFNALTGDEYTTLSGHGIGIINDLATHPIYPSVLASASMDSSIRIWDLKRCSDRTVSPCIIICGHGQGHKEGILTVTWHSRGRYLLSGGHDHMICLWTIPDLSSESGFWDEIAKPRRTAQAVKVIHFPHFISSALHSNYIDCVLFYGDFVLSKAAEEDKIVLWKIEGFNSRMQPPSDVSAPKTKEYLDTRNGFVYKSPDKVGPTDAQKPAYERLLEFAIPGSELFYMRFSVLTPSPKYPDLHPILAFGNLYSKVFFWDLYSLETGRSSHSNGEADRKRYPLQDPHRPLRADLELNIPDFGTRKIDKSFQARGVSWSAEGKWCVFVGEHNQGREDAVAAIFERS